MSDFKTVFSVSQFTRHLSDTLRTHFSLIRIQGELASFTRASSGHWYFGLKDEKAQLKAVMFRQKNVLAGFLPKVGDKVEILAQVSLYEPRGELQVIVETIKPAGQGDLHEQYLRLKAKLQAEGLFESSRKKALPEVTFNLAIVTSLQAAALADIKRTLARRAPHVVYQIYPTQVQGESATAEIVRAIEAADSGRHELILVARGGGSLEDLWCFNTEPVVRAIAACATPVIVGVGHESDVTLAEFAADQRASTPTAAAEMVSPPTEDLLAQVDNLWRHLHSRIERHLERLAQHLDHQEARLVTPAAYVEELSRRLGQSRVSIIRRMTQALVEQSKSLKQQGVGLRRNGVKIMTAEVQKFELLERALPRHSQLLLGKGVQEIRRIESTLNALSPQRNLEKGYAFLEATKESDSESSSLVCSVDQVNKGDQLVARLADGALTVRIQEKSKGSDISG